MEVDFWNERYSQHTYVYGKEANDFLRAQEFIPVCKTLCLAEGEGRNAVYLAEKGHEVSMVDYSQAGIQKALQFAGEKAVSLKTYCADIKTFDMGHEQWDVIVMIFGHLPPEVRKDVHRRIYNALKSGGVFISEGYSKEQLLFKTGGPQDPEVLYSVNDLRGELSAFAECQITPLERIVNEGLYHRGRSAVIQIKAKK